MTIDGGRRPGTGFDVLRRLGAGVFVLAGLLLVHFNVLPLVGGQVAGGVAASQSGFPAADETALQLDPAHDFVRALVRKAAGVPPHRAITPSSGPQPLAFIADTPQSLARSRSAIRTEPTAADRPRTSARIFDARGPPHRAA